MTTLKPLLLPLLSLLVPYLPLLLHNPLTHAADLLFYQPGTCNSTINSSLRCRALGSSDCCVSFAPYCGMLTCDGCDRGDFVHSWDMGNCSGSTNDWCMVIPNPGPDPDDHNNTETFCCASLGVQNSCAGSFEPDHVLYDDETMAGMSVDELRRYAGGLHVTGRRTKCTSRVEPDVMSYVDSVTGLQRHILVQGEDLRKATAMLMAGDYMGLDGFPEWGEFIA